MNRRLRALLAVALLATAATVAAAPAAALAGTSPTGATPTTADATAEPVDAAPTGNASAATAQADAPVGQTVLVNNTAAPGRVVLTYEYDVADRIRGLSVWFAHPDRTTVLESGGFERDEPANYEWRDDGSGPPTLRVALDLNATGIGVDDAGVDPGPWALLFRPVPAAFYYDDGEWIRVESAPEISAAGDDEMAGNADVLFVGDHDEHVRTAGNETLHLVVPSEASLAASPDAILDGLAGASRTLDVGPRRDDVYAVAVPRSIESVWNGYAIGSSFWASADAPMRGPGVTWLHEYVHTRQRWSSATDFWFDEASAEYLTALLALDQGWAGFEETRRYVERVDDPDAVLDDPSTWASIWTQYDKGARVLAATDARIRDRTNYTRSLVDVFRRLNHRSGEVTTETVAEEVVAVAGDERTGTAFREYAATDALPEAPAAPAAYAFPGRDTDGDGLDTAAEARWRTSPFAADTDADGLPDGAEVEGATNATLADTDGDGIDDGTELDGPTDPTLADTDGDGLDDGEERAGSTNATLSDTDGDGIGDGDDECPADPEDDDAREPDDGCPESATVEPTTAASTTGSSGAAVTTAPPTGTTAPAVRRTTVEDGTGGAATPGGDATDDPEGPAAVALAVALFGLWGIGGLSGVLLVGTLLNAGARRTVGRSLDWFDRRSARRLAAVAVGAFVLSGGVLYLIAVRG